MNPYIVFGALVVGVILIFGAANIITASNKSAEMFKQVVTETNTRCDLCLQQFQGEVVCRHDSETKVCVALKNYYCAMNCSVTIT